MCARMHKQVNNLAFILLGNVFYFVYLFVIILFDLKCMFLFVVVEEKMLSFSYTLEKRD